MAAVASAVRVWGHVWVGVKIPISAPVFLIFFSKTEAPFFLLPALGGCAPTYYCIFGHGAPPLAHQCKTIVGRNISLPLVHAPKLMLFHIFDALIGGLTQLQARQRGWAVEFGFPIILWV